ncbi:MAG: ATP-binding protein, partial [Acidiferrobacterales bacterium]
MTPSIQTRLLTAATIVLVIFLGVTGLVLDKAFRDSAESSMQESLQGHVYTLLALGELSDKGLIQMPEDLPDPRFSLAQSGLYARIDSQEAVTIWSSASLLGTTMNDAIAMAAGQRSYRYSRTSDGTQIYLLSYGVGWESTDGRNRLFTLYVAENLDGFFKQVRQFRRSLWVWLALAAGGLILVQGFILRWSLSPLRQVAEDLKDIESGKTEALVGIYPKELTGLTGNLNRLIKNSRSQLQRYRDSLGNLAHSLKTPLAVMQSISEKGRSDNELKKVTREQVTRMSQLVHYQLNRAAVAGVAPLSAPIAVQQIAEKILSALTKANSNKAVQTDVHISSDTLFFGNEDDLYEVMGNLLENAFKWCHHRVEIAASNHDKKLLNLSVSDDGPGIEKVLYDEILKRGTRADETTPGHGIG